MPHFARVRNSDGWFLGRISLKGEDAAVNENDAVRLVPIEDPMVFDAMGTCRYVNGEFVQEDPPVTVADIRAARFREFKTITDPMVTGGRDFDRDWKRYVKDLREITDGDKGEKDYDIDHVLGRFPARPDGVDAIKKLRERRAKELRK